MAKHARKIVPVYCLDSCYLIDWVQETRGREKETAIMAETLEDMEAGECKVVISSAVVAEVLPGKCGERYAEFTRLLSGASKLLVRHLDVSIASTVAQLREDLDFSSQRRTVDAMHLATAIHSESDVLYTRDPDLLNLHPKVEEWLRDNELSKLRIQELESQRLPLDSGRSRSASAD